MPLFLSLPFCPTPCTRPPNLLVSLVDLDLIIISTPWHPADCSALDLPMQHSPWISRSLDFLIFYLKVTPAVPSPMSVDDNLDPEVKESQNLRVVLFPPLSLSSHIQPIQKSLQLKAPHVECFCSSLEVAAPSTILVQATVTSHWNRSGGSNWPPCFHPASQPYHPFLTQRPEQSFSNINETILLPQ